MNKQIFLAMIFGLLMVGSALAVPVELRSVFDKITSTLKQGEYVTVPAGLNDHEVGVVDVSDNHRLCGLYIDGDVIWTPRRGIVNRGSMFIQVFRVHRAHEPSHNRIPDQDSCTLSIWCTSGNSTVPCFR